MSEELKPCPFCGSDPTEHAIEPHTHTMTLGDFKMPDHEGSHVIECACGAGFVDDTREAAVTRWNTRALTQRPAAQADAFFVLDDEAKAMIVNNHHYTPENIWALIEQLKSFADPTKTNQADWDNLDWRGFCNVLWRVMMGLSCDLPTQPAAQATPDALAGAWDDGYRLGVADERTAEANIGVAGFGAKVNPARQNPYRTQQATPEPVGEPALWVLTRQLEQRETTHRGYLWFGNPQNVSWTPLYTRPAPGVPEAWDEGYRQGVEDERTSEANIGIAGFDAKVSPARQNPYRAAAQAKGGDHV